MSQRRIFLDAGIGETRGVVTLDGRPERLFIRRESEEARLVRGARSVARVAGVEAALATAFLDLGEGVEAILSFKPGSRPVRGEALEVEIRAEPRRGKLAIVRVLGKAEGAPRLLAEAPPLAETLSAYARGSELVQGPSARAVADEAQAEALEVLHPLPGGGLLAVEPTRALTAVDVDLGERKGSDAKRLTRQANLAAIALAARLLRLKALGGIVVLDLVGRGHDAAALMAAARAGFAPDNPGVAIAPVGRFGTMELSLPRRWTPIAEKLCREDGEQTACSLALGLVRRLQAEAAAQPGARLLARCAPDVAAAAAPLSAQLAYRIGSRFTIRPDAGWPRSRPEVSTL